MLSTLMMSLWFHYLTMASRHVLSPRRLAAYWCPGGAARRGLYGAVNLQDPLHYQATPAHGHGSMHRAEGSKPLLTSHRLAPPWPGRTGTGSGLQEVDVYVK